ncbi:MAG TPA: PKD domain-containing protein [Rudaea sp.]|nr:PKD domain-containing protein [Rudaea sp.]
MFRKVLLALGALFVGNAFAQSSFSVYFNGESSSANCHVDGVSNAQLSTTGSGNLVATAALDSNGKLQFSTACGISGTAQPLTFGPAQDLLPTTQTLAAGSNVPGNFSVRPFNAASCTAAIGTTSGSGMVSPTSLNVCTSQSSCANLSNFSANFTNTSNSASTYSTQVTCTAAAGASPATLKSQTVTINQNAAGALSNATINGSANGSTSATVNAAVSFTGAVTNPNNDPVTYSWNFGDGSATGSGPTMSHTYTTTTGSPFTVTLTVTDTATNQTLNATNTVTVSAGGSCPTYASSTSGISNYTRLTGTQNVYYFGPTYTVDITSFDSVFGAGGTPSQQVWPGKKGLSGVITLATNKYVSLQFTVPAGFMELYPSGVYGKYTLNTSQYSAPVGMTIITQCGDFSNPSAYPSTSKVVSGCWINDLNSSNGALRWANTGACTLQDGATYFLNMINADISTAQPAGGGTLSSSKTANCGSACTDPLTNGPGTW